MAALRTIKIDVISDLLCPWCYIGHVELERAISQAQEANLPVKFEIQYHPFLLHPSLNCEKPVSKDDFYAAKLGKEKYESIKKLCIERAEAEGLKITFDGVMRQTTRAHRLLMKAYRTGGQDMQLKLLRELFVAFFEQQTDIGDVDVLAGFAEVAGVYTKDEAVVFLKSDELEGEVLIRSADAEKKGVSGVPTTIIDGKWAVNGGVTPDVYYKVFEKLTSAPEPAVLAPQAIAASA